MVAPGVITREQATAAEASTVDGPHSHIDYCEDNVMTDSNVDVALFNKIGISIPCFEIILRMKMFRSYSIMQNETMNWLQKAENISRFNQYATVQTCLRISSTT